MANVNIVMFLFRFGASKPFSTPIIPIVIILLFSVPVKPKHSQMITLNTTTVTVWLDSWGDGGCGILYFVIEYREISQSQVTFIDDS